MNTDFNEWVKSLGFVKYIVGIGDFTESDEDFVKERTGGNFIALSASDLLNDSVTLPNEIDFIWIHQRTYRKIPVKDHEAIDRIIKRLRPDGEVLMHINVAYGAYSSMLRKLERRPRKPGSDIVMLRNSKQATQEPRGDA